jgi:hypothetical protein
MGRGAAEAPVARENVAAAFAGSHEHLYDLARGIAGQYLGLHQQFFHRPGSDPEWNSWATTQAQTGWPDELVIAKFLASTEYNNAHPSNLAWVQGVYSDLLRRPGCPPEWQGWVGQLNAGASRESVGWQLATTPESEQIIVRLYYSAYLLRGASDAEVNGWAGVLAARAATREQVITAFVTSDEFVARTGQTNAGWLTALYNRLLGRPPLDSGYFAWLDVLWSRTQVASRGVVRTIRPAGSVVCL